MQAPPHRISRGRAGVAILPRMSIADHKATRRAILELLYHAYLEDPLRMVEPEAFHEESAAVRSHIVPNMHYLADRKLVEMMIGYSPPLFSAVRITPGGIDLVENRFEFDRLFPALPGTEAGPLQAIPMILERLVEEGDFIAVDGTTRRQLLGDILYLREELSLPPERWRRPLIDAVMDAVESAAGTGGLAALAELREAVSGV